MSQVRTILLGLLQQKPLYGYQIIKMLQEGQYADWVNVPVASLYYQLGQMADEGLIERVGAETAGARPARVIYQIAERGSVELRRLLRAAWSDTDAPRSPQDVAVFFMDALPQDDLVAALLQRLEQLRSEYQRLSTQFRERVDRDLAPMVRSVWDRAQRRLEGEIAWTEELLAQAQAGAYHRPHVAPQPSTPAVRRQPRRTQPGQGAFTFVLHSHLPYCRMAGRWPHGEEWIHEAAAETYVPLLNALYDLKEEGVDYRLTVSLTPVLTEQLADYNVMQHFLLYLDEEIERASGDVPRFGEADERHLEYLAGWYRDYYAEIKRTFLERFDGDIVGAYRRLQDEGYLEIITSAATHGYLPLLARDSSIYGQLRAGVESYRRHFGRLPRAIWLPECAYRPAYVDDDGVTRPALEEFLANLGITAFFVETHALEGGRPVGKAAGDVFIGPYAAVQRRYVLPTVETAGTGGTTFRAYYVVGNAHGLTSPPVAALGRNNRTGQQVWSAEWGYPGEADYREFHRKDHESGLQYWRVTGPRVDLGSKDYYHPDWAEAKALGHARHYAGLVEQLVHDYAEATGEYGIISSNYDAELFGHWWFEGVDWIREVLRLLAESPVVDLTTVSDYLREHEPEQVLALPESSWGAGGTHWTWDNPDTHWMWQPIHEAERHMERLVERYPSAEGDLLAVLNQAGRELLLLQSSDWPFLVTTGQAGQYAIERFRSHLDRFQRLADLAEHGVAMGDRALAEAFFELDKVFPGLDYRWFKARQGKAD